MLGLVKVKAFVERIVDLAVENIRLEEEEEELLVIGLNRVLLGNPGTGKTTFAVGCGGGGCGVVWCVCVVVVCGKRFTLTRAENLRGAIRPP